MKKFFKLTDEECAKIEKWAKEHECPCRNTSCIGGEISVIFTPTSIGTTVKVRCICGKGIIIRKL